MPTFDDRKDGDDLRARPISFSMPYSPPTTARWMAVDDGIVLWDESANRFVDLNESASELWVVLSSSQWLPSAAVEHLCTTYGFDKREASKIVDQLIKNLLAHGALAIVARDAAVES